MHKGITKLRKGYYVIIYLRHASKLDNEAKTLRNHTCQLDLINEKYIILMDYIYCYRYIHLYILKFYCGWITCARGGGDGSSDIGLGR